MSKQDLIARAHSLAQRGKNLPYESPLKEGWEEECVDLFHSVYETKVAKDKVKRFLRISTQVGAFSLSTPREVFEQCWRDGLSAKVAMLSSVVAFLEGTEESKPGQNVEVISPNSEGRNVQFSGPVTIHGSSVQVGVNTGATQSGHNLNAQQTKHRLPSDSDQRVSSSGLIDERGQPSQTTQRITYLLLLALPIILALFWFTLSGYALNAIFLTHVSIFEASMLVVISLVLYIETINWIARRSKYLKHWIVFDYLDRVLLRISLEVILGILVSIFVLGDRGSNVRASNIHYLEPGEYPLILDIGSDEVQFGRVGESRAFRAVILPTGDANVKQHPIQWFVTENNVSVETAVGQEFMFVPKQPGNYNVVARCTDEDRQLVAWSTSIEYQVNKIIKDPSEPELTVDISPTSAEMVFGGTQLLEAQTHSGVKNVTDKSSFLWVVTRDNFQISTSSSSRWNFRPEQRGTYLVDVQASYKGSHSFALRRATIVVK